EVGRDAQFLAELPRIFRREILTDEAVAAAQLRIAEIAGWNAQGMKCAGNVVAGRNAIHANGQITVGAAIIAVRRNPVERVQFVSVSIRRREYSRLRVIDCSLPWTTGSHDCSPWPKPGSVWGRHAIRHSIPAYRSWRGIGDPMWIR